LSASSTRQTLARTDRNGVSVADAIRNFGLDPAELPSAVLDESAFAYLEFHIEQGPVLESEGLALGVVDAIAGQTRMTYTFTGHANHAGTTPMGPLRHDALAAAAEWIVEVERYAGATPGLVATVGKVEVPSAAGNVIAGTCIATLDVRHAQDKVREAAVHHFLAAPMAASEKRGVAVSTTVLDQAAVPMDPVLTALLAEAAARATGRAARGHHQRRRSRCHDRRPPGARRHALPALARRNQSPSARGVLPADVEAALAAGVEFLRILRDDRAMLERHTGARTSRLRREDLNA
jgi:allantoate deiminase